MTGVPKYPAISVSECEWCNQYSIPPLYPSRLRSPSSDESIPFVPPGYYPVRPNPGGLKFYMYDYTYHTRNGGVPLQWRGRGWDTYTHYGVYP